MKFLSKKIYIILILLIIFFGGSETFAKGSQIQYKSENIYNYFSGIISANQDYNDKAFEHLKKVTFLKNSHSNFNVEFIRTLVLIEKFEKAVEFSRSIWNEEELIFEADLLLGLESFLKKDYVSAERYFDRLNRLSEHNIFFDNFIGNVLTAWSKASQGNKKGSFDSIKKIPEPYDHLKKPQNIFLQCYFDDIETKKSFQELSNDNKYNFSRYNFFLVNYLIHRDRAVEAKKVIKKSREKYPSNILIKETENFLLKNKNKKIKNFFDCKNTKDSIAEFFYVIANIYSSEKDYQLSNFYLKISILLNERFTSNKALLAENYYFQKKNKYSKNIYESLKSIGPTYSWYAAKNIAEILEKEKGKKYSVDSLQKEKEHRHR